MITIDSRWYIETVMSDHGDLRHCLCRPDYDDEPCYDKDAFYSVCPDDDAGFYQQACCFLLESLNVATDALRKIGAAHVFDSAGAAEKWARDIANNALEEML